MAQNEQQAAAMQQQMQQRQAQQEQQQQLREQKAAMLNQILSEEAATRLGAIATVKPDKAEKLETIILTNAQRGQIQGKVSEAQLLDLLEQVHAIDAEAGAGAKVERNKHAFDSEDELDLDNLDI